MRDRGLEQRRHRRLSQPAYNSRLHRTVRDCAGAPPAGSTARNLLVPFGNGYLMVAEDGGVFNFSDQPFSGSLGDNPPANPIVSITPLS